VNETETLDALVRVWSRDIAPHVRRDCCILGARVASGVLSYWNHGNRVLPCRAFVMNAEAAQLIANDVPASEWPRDGLAWSIGTHTEPRPGGYSGHVIVRTDAGTLVDLSASQWHRPRRIEVDGPRVWRAADIEERNGVFIINEGTLWWRFEPTRDRTYRTAPDWRRAPVGEVIRTIKRETERVN